MSSHPNKGRGLTRPLLALAAVWGAALWAVWNPTALDWVQRWSSDPTYSHGFLVPLFALGLLWWKRDAVLMALTKGQPRPSWWGVPVVLAGAGLHFVGSYIYFRWLQGAGFLLYLAGGALVVAGWPLLRSSWQAIAYLLFMIPLPFRVEESMRVPLMQFATSASTFLLQLCGLPAIARGFTIEVNQHQLGVAEACSGLKMLITFVALAVGLVMVIKRPLLDKVVILASAVPIAIISNVIRITATGLLYVYANAKLAEFVYHDLAGYLMMPLGVGLMWCEMKVLESLFIEPKAPDPNRLRDMVLGPVLAHASVPVSKPKPPSLGDFDL